jgi:2-oxoglutarate dehydrogenase E1 component
LAESLTTIPHVTPHQLVKKVCRPRRDGRLRGDSGGLGQGEHMALASLRPAVSRSVRRRYRGTFSHRHAVIHDQNREKFNEGALFQNVVENQAPLVVIDLDPVRRGAVLAFEYGYASNDPNTWWEAQFGDFANGAQVVTRPTASGEVRRAG